jgi:hypothetical protein
MMTSSLRPTAATISVMSSSAHGEASALMRVHSPVAPNSLDRASVMKPARAASLASAGIALEIAEDHVDIARRAGTFAVTFSMRRDDGSFVLAAPAIPARNRRADRKLLVEREFRHASSAYKARRA